MPPAARRPSGPGRGAPMTGADRLPPPDAAERIAALERDNARLRRLLDGRDAPGELRHRLRSTLTLLRGIVQRTADTARDLPDYVAHLEDRLDAITRAQAAADRYGEVDLGTLLADELLRYGASEGAGLRLSGPEVRLRPKAGQVLALAIHELAVNAVEHGVLGAPGGEVEVLWALDDAGPEATVRHATVRHATLGLAWTERGPAPVAGAARRGFGTDVLTRMLAYELGAETRTAFEPHGLRCTIRFPLPEWVGRVAAG